MILAVVVLAFLPHVELRGTSGIAAQQQADRDDRAAAAAAAPAAVVSGAAAPDGPAGADGSGS